MVLDENAMSKNAKARLKRLRYASRSINRAAWERTGGGAHTNGAQKRTKNARKDWRAEWEL